MTIGATSSYDGHVDRIDNGWIFGWAWNSERPNEPIAVEVCVDGVPHAKAMADLYRVDLEQRGKGDGKHGFEIALPVPQGHRSRIDVRFAGSAKDVPGGPKYLEPSAPALPSGACYRSRFGGLWTDLSNARALIAGKSELGWITSEEARLLESWVKNGYVILPGAVSDELVDRLDRDVESVWDGTTNEQCFVEYHRDGSALFRAGPDFRDKHAKLLDLHAHFDSARQVVFSPAIVRFVSLLFERPMLAFQCLYFRWGSRQPIHQDTAFVKVSSPLELVASWIALEDVKPGSGELEYYRGSHGLPDFLFDGRHKWMPTKSTECDGYHQWLHDKSSELGLERERFLPKKGDVLLWSADLAHGGSEVVNESLTRKSIVTHYCPIDCDPWYTGAAEPVERSRHGELTYYSVSRRT